MQNKLLTGIALGLVLVASAAMAEGNNGVAAKIGNETLTVKEIREMYDNNATIKDRIPFDTFYIGMVNNFVGSKAIYLKAKQEKLQNNAEFKKQLAVMEEELLRRFYLEQEMKNKISDADVKKAYKQYKDEFKAEKEVRAKHILTKDEKTAKDVIAQLKKGGNFDDLAKKNSIDKQVDLGYFTQNMMVPEFGEAVFKMKKGKYSEKPVKTQFGYHVVLVEDVRETKPFTKEQAEPQIKDMLAKKEIADTVEKAAKEMKAERYKLNGELVEE